VGSKISIKGTQKSYNLLDRSVENGYYRLILKIEEQPARGILCMLRGLFPER